MSVTSHVKSETAHELAKEELKTTHQNAMPLNLALLRIAGIARLPKGKANACRKILYKVQVVLFQALLFPVNMGQFMALYHFWGDLDICTNNLFTLLAAIMTYAEGMYARIKAREIEELFETFQTKVVTKMMAVDFKDKKKEIYEAATKRARLMTIIMIIILDFLPLTWIQVPFIRLFMEENNNLTNNEIEDDKKWLNFCFVIWYPIDITVSPYFEIVYLYQAMLYIVGAIYLKAVDLTLGAMMVHIAAQFEILCIDLKNIDMIISVAEEKKKESRILQKGAVDVCREDSDKLLVTDAGYHAEGDSQVCQTARVRGHDGNTEGKNEDLSDPTCYLAHFVQYHQTVIQ
jgi:hypothetical protein